jgi:integrase
LTATDVDLQLHAVRVVAQAVELRDGTRVVTPPKTDAGRGVVHLPLLVTDALAWHLNAFPPRASGSLVFTGPLSDGLRRATLQKAWVKARQTAGFPALHLHDLRHEAGTLAAQTGATTREVMARLGHASLAAAQRYQHAAERRDAVIANALDVVLGALSRPGNSTGNEEPENALWGWRGVGDKAPLATEAHTPPD